jgi:hypothetical protein
MNHWTLDQALTDQVICPNLQRPVFLCHSEKRYFHFFLVFIDGLYCWYSGCGYQWVMTQFLPSGNSQRQLGQLKDAWFVFALYFLLMLYYTLSPIIVLSTELKTIQIWFSQILIIGTIFAPSRMLLLKKYLALSKDQSGIWIAHQKSLCCVLNLQPFNKPECFILCKIVVLFLLTLWNI